MTNLMRIHMLSTNKFNNFDELINEYILSGIEIFRMETGIVSRIDDRQRYHVIEVVSPLKSLEKGQVFRVDETYCRTVFESQRVVGIPHVGKMDYMKCHPVYQALRLESYLAAPIYVGEKLYGTLNFTSLKPRAFGFSQHEHNLILLMANSIGAYILLRSKEDNLLALNEKMKRFVGYVAHDMRNPLGAIIGFTKLAQLDNLPTNKVQNLLGRILGSAERALELVTTILENAALSSGKISLDTTSEAVSRLLEDAVDLVTDFADDCQIRICIIIERELSVSCDANRIRQTLMNLLVNAIKYSPNSEDVNINAFSEGKNCKIQLVNLIGAGEAKLFGHRKIYDSIGFGLDIVQEVLRAHDSQLITRELDGQYIAEFTLPLAF